MGSKFHIDECVASVYCCVGAYNLPIFIASMHCCLRTSSLLNNGSKNATIILALYQSCLDAVPPCSHELLSIVQVPP